MTSPFEVDDVIVGGGVMGLALARELSLRKPGARILILEKENQLASHASGRNSGVLHAGFYYAADSLKARLTREGNKLLTDYCHRAGLPIQNSGKVVVTTDASQLSTLGELFRRGQTNGVSLSLLDEKELSDLEPNAQTVERALFSPSTSTIDPLRLLLHIASNLPASVTLSLGEKFIGRLSPREIRTNRRVIRFGHLINAAGLYADVVAHQFDVGRNLTLLPFKGVYLEYTDNTLLGRSVYPVPDLANPFLGVHFTCTVDGLIKVGPTAMPAFWRENYGGLHRFHLGEMARILGWETRLLATNAFGFRRLAFQEMRKYFRSHFIAEALKLVKKLDASRFGRFLKPGIRAQMLDCRTQTLVSDFVVEKGERSTHILNAVSPGLTCSFSFARYVADLMERG